MSKARPSPSPETSPADKPRWVCSFCDKDSNEVVVMVHRTSEKTGGEADTGGGS